MSKGLRDGRVMEMTQNVFNLFFSPFNFLIFSAVSSFNKFLFSFFPSLYFPSIFPFLFFFCSSSYYFTPSSTYITLSILLLYLFQFSFFSRLYFSYSFVLVALLHLVFHSLFNVLVLQFYPLPVSLFLLFPPIFSSVLLSEMNTDFADTERSARSCRTTFKQMSVASGPEMIS
jgi:hypothetical protein